jgi:histidyl-tRNA synthetase
MKYANARGVRHVAMLGANEIEAGHIQLKNMDSGDQQLLTIEEIIEAFK